MRGALAVLARHGVDAFWSGGAEGLFEIAAIRRRTAGVSRAGAQQALRDLLGEAIETVPTQQYRDLLRIVLSLDPAASGMSARERRELAGKRFRGGDRPVAWGTIRQYHEPQALDQLAVALLALDTSKAEPRPAKDQFRRPPPPAANFGDPDGARADPASVLDEFVPIDFAGGGSSRLGDDRLSRLARIIVGRKGSGKTLYLRRLCLSQKGDSSFYTDSVSTQMPPTDRVVRVGEMYPSPLITERWKALWRLAILRSVLSHMTQSVGLSSLLGAPDLFDLRQMYEALGGAASTPRSIGAELSDVLFQHPSRATLDKLLGDPRIDDAEYYLGEYLRQMPPLFFYVDGLDDEYSHAPRHWLRCQAGLFYQVMQLTRDARLGGRLRVTVAMRDVVYASVARTEHASRYFESPYIVNLRWTSELARGFLEAKVRRLAPEVVCNEVDEPDIADWLGRATIRDPSRGAERPLVDYLIDHTRALPRDVVVLGNKLCREIEFARRSGESLTDETIRKVIDESARLFGWEQLTIAVSQIVSNLTPNSRVDDYADIYGAGTPYAEFTAGRFASILAPYGSGESLTSNDLENLGQRCREEFELDDLTSILWENDLLGVETADGATSYRYEVLGEDLRMPLSVQAYRLHPILESALSHREDRA